MKTITLFIAFLATTLILAVFCLNYPQRIGKNAAEIAADVKFKEYVKRAKLLDLTFDGPAVTTVGGAKYAFLWVANQGSCTLEVLVSLDDSGGAYLSSRNVCVEGDS